MQESAIQPVFLSDRAVVPVLVTQLLNPAGKCHYHCEHGHTLFMSLAPRPIQYLQAQNGKTHTGRYKKGDISIVPANTPLYVRWDGDEHGLELQLT